MKDYASYYRIDGDIMYLSNQKMTLEEFKEASYDKNFKEGIVDVIWKDGEIAEVTYKPKPTIK